MNTALSSDLYFEEPVVSFVDTLLQTAIAQSASDIHIEPSTMSIRIRFRIDGILHDYQAIIDDHLVSRMIARLKILARIDIAEKRVPQDGKFRFSTDKNSIDLRVSTFPTMYGEKVVIRILDRASQIIALDTLGFSKNTLERFQQLLHKPQGFILVCGPTGSGKTTTLYAALATLNVPEKNIITLEDPIEYDIKGITQGQVNPEMGFTFAKGMRALLRQDPDIVMVGEIRDKETAQIAHEAAMTGHLVLSTVHTNDSASVIMRLMDMGVEPYLINASLHGVLAQRLARKICQQCKIEMVPNEQETKFFDTLQVSVNTIYKGIGCNACFGLGYKGRIGIFELLTVTNSLRSLMVCQPIYEEILKQAQIDGMQTLLYDGAVKVSQGLISFEELMRVVV